MAQKKVRHEQVDVGTNPDQLVKLDELGRLPAVDASQLTNAPGGDLVSDLTPQLGGNLDLNSFSMFTPAVGSPASANAYNFTFNGGDNNSAAGTFTAGGAFINGGAATAGNDGGPIALNGGDSVGGYGGYISLIAGNGAGGGTVTITSGNSNSTISSGDIDITAGDNTNAAGAAPAGDITINAGDSTVSASGVGGDIILTPGQGNNDNGAVVITQRTAPSVTTNKLYNDGGTLYWNGVDVLTSGASALNDLTDVIVAGSPLVTDQVLKFNGTIWVNAADNNITDHTLLSNIGTNSHTDIDNHISDSSIHFTAASLNLDAKADLIGSPAVVPNSQISESSITQHETALTVTASQVSDFNTEVDSRADARIAIASIDDLADVFTSGGSPVLITGQVLTYNSVTGQWENETPSSGVTDHTLLSNIGTNTHAQIDTHIADNTIHFTKSSINLNDLGNVVVAGSPEGQILKFVGGVWTSAPEPNSAVWGNITGTLSNQTDLQAVLDTKLETVALNDLTDVIVAGSPAISGQVLTFNGTNWVNAEGATSNNWIYANNGADFGTAPVATGTEGIAIGHLADAGAATYPVAIGRAATALGHSSVALGRAEVTSGGTYGIAVGVTAKTTASDGVAMARNSKAYGTQSVAIGFGTQASAASSIAIGNSADANDADSISIGNGAYCRYARGVAIGKNTNAGQLNGVAIGNAAVISASAAGGVAIGNGASSAGDSVSIGSATSSTQAIAIGRLVTANGANVAIGNVASATGIDAISIGDGTTVAGAQGIGIGHATTAALTNQVSVGVDLTSASVTSDVAYSAKLGTGTGVNKNMLHIYNKGKLELYGDEAQFIIPPYAVGGSPTNYPANSVEGGLIYDSVNNVLKLYNGATWSDVGGSSVSILNDLIDVAVAGSPLVTGQVLTYNGSIWTNQAPDGIDYIQYYNDNPVTIAPIATGVDSISIGSDTASTGFGCTAVGNDISITGNRAVAIGDTVNVLGDEGVAIGRSTDAQTDSVAVGRLSKANGGQSVAIGNDATTAAASGIAIGDSNDSVGASSIAIGDTIVATPISQTAIGQNIAATTITNEGFTNDNYSVIIGYGAANVSKNTLYLHDKGKLALFGDEAQYILPNYGGSPNITGVEGGLVYSNVTNGLKVFDGTSWNNVGGGASTLNELTDVIVAGSPAVSGQVLTFNGTSWVNAEGAVSYNWIHANNGTDFATAPVGTGTGAIAMGTGADTGNDSSAIAIGTSATTKADQDICIGRNAQNNSANTGPQVIIGYGASSTYNNGSNQVIIGRNASVHSNFPTSTYGVSSVIAIGHNATASNIGQTVIGKDAIRTSTTADYAYSVKLGHGLTGADKNMLHLYSKGKLELYGDEAQYILPNYGGSPNIAGVEGGLVYSNVTNGLKIFDGTTWNDVGGGGVENPLTADLDTGGYSIITASSAVLNENTDNITITAGSHYHRTAGAANYGNIDITAGNNSGYHKGGTITLQGGTGSGGSTGFSSDAEGGDVNLYAGISSVNSSFGGKINIVGGTHTNSGTGGQVNITGGYGSSLNGPGGPVTITGGKAQGAGIPGKVSILGGDCTQKTGAQGGDIDIIGGNNLITGGYTYAGQRGGNILIQGGEPNVDNVNAVGGNVTLRPGAGGATAGDGAVQIGNADGTGYGEFKILDEAGGYSTTVRVSALGSDTTFQLPATNGSASQVLITDGAGNTSWADAATGGGKPQYESIIVQALGSPASEADHVINTTVPTVGLAGSPLLASLQVFRNGMLQDEDLDAGSPLTITEDFKVTGPNQITFAPGTLAVGGKIKIFAFT